MDWILFLLGAGLIFMGKVNIGNISAEGPPVRAAGFILMMPVIVGLVLGIGLSMIFGSDTAAFNTGFNILLVVQLIVIVVCTAVAYNLLRGASSVTEDEQDTPQETPKPTMPSMPSFMQRQPQVRPRTEFPSVMNTAEAAHYLNVTENDVIQMIDEGKLVAAKINYRFKISRSVLDDFLAGGNMEPEES